MSLCYYSYTLSSVQETSQYCNSNAVLKIAIGDKYFQIYHKHIFCTSLQVMDMEHELRELRLQIREKCTISLTLQNKVRCRSVLVCAQLVLLVKYYHLRV